MVLDILIKGLGTQAAITAGLAAEPWLNLPIAKWFFVNLVKLAGAALETVIKRNVGNIIIRWQGDSRKDAYDKVLEEFKESTAPGVSKEEHAKKLQAARDAIDRVINKSH